MSIMHAAQTLRKRARPRYMRCSGARRGAREQPLHPGSAASRSPRPQLPMHWLLLLEVSGVSHRSLAPLCLLSDCLQVTQAAGTLPAWKEAGMPGRRTAKQMRKQPSNDPPHHAPHVRLCSSTVSGLAASARTRAAWVQPLPFAFSPLQGPKFRSVHLIVE